jgi:hypothetical protein
MRTGAGRAIALIVIIMASYRTEVTAAEASAPTVPRPMNSVGLEYGALSTNGFEQSQYGVRSKIKLFSLGDGRYPRGSEENTSPPPKTVISPRTCTT